MFGDCQVMSSMGGGSGISSESIFPNFNFMPYTDFSSIIPKEEMESMARSGKEEMDSGSGSDQIEGGLSGNEQDIDPQQPPSKKKRYHRHTAHQIQEMEALFKENPHPDDKRRMRLSQELGLKPRQVKFWFQNRRTQMKAQQDRADNAVLRNDNENLRNENSRLQNALRALVCSNCGGSSISFDEQQLRMENARLKEELDRVCLIASQFCGNNQMQAQVQAPLHQMMNSNLDLDMNMYPRSAYDQEQGMQNCNEMMQMNNPLMPPQVGPNFAAANGLMIMDDEKPLAIQYAISFMDEVVKMCRVDEPLWTQVNDVAGKEVLNLDEYAKMFPLFNSRKNDLGEFKYEASRAKSVVIINSITLVDAFLDADKWMELFPSIISRAKTLQVITSGVNRNANGSLQLMYAELQMLSPLVPTREIHFLRYCAQDPEDGSWAIVDFPLESFHETYQTSLTRYKRRPSGCIIQDMPNGYSRVSWVEHAEVEDEPVHGVYADYVGSGIAFGAQRWLAVLQRQCERLASLLARNISDIGVIPSPEARTNLMNLAQRMVRMFCLQITGSCGQSWTALSDSVEDTVRITTRKVTEPGQPNGLILTAVSTTWLPHPHYQVFDLLRDERQRSQIDVLSNGNPLQEVAHIANGSHPGNCISLFRINVASNSSQNVELVLQESCTDESGSLVVHSVCDVDAIKLTMSGEDPSCIPLLPLGFVIVPAGRNPNGNINAGTTTTTESNEGCLLTVGLQMLANSMPNAKLNLSSANTINNHIQTTMQQIISALGGFATNNIGNTTDTNSFSAISVNVDDVGNIGGFDEPPTNKVESSSTSTVN
ncbi:homeobox-leucine zipper protein HDG5-like [Rutidosis leptorrhynchoides]|uniref:homeobox-leucine zipper protein HDG5-like n=1 Tax=Rutidosis leptorrhynchoides TaxID=125765 RepID=UPI003A9A496C